MNRIDNSKYLLYIEPDPNTKTTNPVNDELTTVLQRELDSAVKGVGRYSNTDDIGTFTAGTGWRGKHRTDCGESSTNVDYLLSNGLITNSLCVFYLQYYRSQIPQSEIDKIKTLMKKTKETKSLIDLGKPYLRELDKKLAEHNRELTEGKAETLEVEKGLSWQEEVDKQVLEAQKRLYNKTTEL
jgi:hypothetical protein